MNNEANKYAQQQADTFRNSLQYLIDQQNQQKLIDEQTATSRYQNLLTQINQQIDPINTQYKNDAQQAYINKMLGSKEIEANLSQMGLNTQGFGVTQQALNESSYGSNLNALKINRNETLQNLENQATNATGEYNTDLLSLSSDYSGRLSELMQAIESQVASKYDTTYDNYVKNQQYKDALKQQAEQNKLSWYNAYTSRKSVNNPALDRTTFDDILGTPRKTYNDADIVTANKSPKFLSSSTARQWFNSNVTETVIANKGIAIGNLKTLLQGAYNKNIINDSDVTKILATFGLQ
jgi:hypothetical protein